MNYFLTLPQGAITVNRGQFVGSHTVGIWSPFNPVHNNGWQEGDTLTIVATFNLYPENLAPNFPRAFEYVGLSAAALNRPTRERINQVIGQLMRPSRGTVAEGITENSTPNNATDIFYNVVSETETISLQPSSRGTIQNLVYQWKMDYNSNYENVDPMDIELIFGYGDPMDTEEQA